MTRAIVVRETGGPEKLLWENVDVGKPGEGEVRIRHTAIGLNYIDVYFRAGLYPAPHLPFSPGFEGAGVVEAVGEAVDDFAVGDRVCYGTSPIGAYAESRLIPAANIVRIPDGIDDHTAAAMMLQGMTAQYLLRRTYTVQPGDTILFHAAAGGVGLIACQWAKYLGATVIGTVGSVEKAALAKAHGCDHTILYREENFVDRVREITNGRGVPVVYDSIGKDTYPASLDCLSPFGLMVSFGNASGAVENFDPGLLALKGCLYFTRPTLFTYTARREDLEMTANDLFDVVGNGVIRINTNQTYPLADAAQAHRDLVVSDTASTEIYTV
ncbi:MAG: quinone oxidoreductase [Rhodospirillaceae bacterium]|nr:quinone oxidoreductase [Rhodospirillaceae bacterium]